MKRKILMSLLAASLFIGCANKKHPIVEVPVVEKEEVVVPVQNVEKETQEEVVIVKKKEKKIPSTSYKVIPKKIETFTYNKLSKDGIVDDSKLKNSSYLSDDSIRIEKIFNSKSGARYGKVAGKKILVSMDDLAKK